MKSKELEALKEVIEAWESLSGDTSYSLSIVERWLIKDMKPAIDNARKVIREVDKE